MIVFHLAVVLVHSKFGLGSCSQSNLNNVLSILHIVEGNECLGQWMPIRWIALPYTHPDMWTAFYHTPNLGLVDGGGER